MDTPSLQLTLREWRMHMAQPARVFALIGAAVILTLVAPFETGAVMAALPRLAYWGVLVFASYGIGYAANLSAKRLAPQSLIRCILISGALTGLGALICVYLLNGLALQYWAIGRDLAVLATNVVVISIVISAIFQVAYAGAENRPERAPPAILDRIAFDKRAALVALSVEDHYVRVRTLRGEEMVLMRLSDAIRETGDVAGLQVHRSHWVALDQVQGATRRGDGAVLTMSHGPEIPVSRANLAKIKDAGLLPK